MEFIKCRCGEAVPRKQLIEHYSRHNEGIIVPLEDIISNLKTIGYGESINTNNQ